MNEDANIVQILGTAERDSNIAELDEQLQLAQQMLRACMYFTLTFRMLAPSADISSSFE